MPDSIRGRCRTNLDAFANEQWPDRFAFPPRCGDAVQSRSSGRWLVVVRVIHVQGKGMVSGEAEIVEPSIVVELHHAYIGH
jgi:hypothetical protein